MYTLKVGRSVSFNDGFESNIFAAEKAGLDTLDFDLCANWREREKEIEQYKKIEEGLKRIEKSPLCLNGVHISFGATWEYSDLDEEIRTNAVRLTKEIFERVDGATPYCYILHGSWEPIKDEVRAQRLEQMKKSLRELRQYTHTRLCLEDLPRTCLGNTSAEILGVLKEVKGIDVCLDSNHFLKERPETAVLALGKSIKTTHISDYDFVDERHWLPGQGKINWNAFIGALEKVGYDGVFNYEVNETAEAIKENYVKLFENYNQRR